MLKKVQQRLRRKKRIRKKLLGTSDQPRLTVYRSLRYIYAQVIDDMTGKTLVAASSLEKKKGGGNKSAAGEIGKLIAAQALAKNIKRVQFDRNGYLYHGVVKSLADAAREGGLKF